MCRKGIIAYSIWQKKSEGKIIRFKSTDYWMESRDLRCKSNTSCCQYGPEQPAKCSAAPDSVMGLRSASALRRRRKLHPHVRTQLPPAFSLTAYSLFSFCNGVQREHNKKLNNGLPILHKVPPKRDYGRYFCIMAEKGGTSHGGLTEKLSPFFHAKKQEVNAYGR